MKKSTAVSALSVAGALATALAFASPAFAADEQCFGIAMKGQNDCRLGATLARATPPPTSAEPISNSFLPHLRNHDVA